MGTRPKKWPTNANAALEDTLAVLHEICKLAREAQLAAVAGDFPQVVITNGDVREIAQKAILYLTQAKTGTYQ